MNKQLLFLMVASMLWYTASYSQENCTEHCNLLVAQCKSEAAFAYRIGSSYKSKAVYNPACEKKGEACRAACQRK